jgi:two-component system, NarL family, nitrate/nitrite response regulator NarL
MPAVAAESKPIRVLLVDDHAVLRSGLRLLIESQPGQEVVGEAGNRTDALAAVEREQPDVILLDLALPGTDGLDLLPELLAAAKEARVLILTGVLDPEAHTRAMRLGAVGVVLKEKAPEVLIKAIEKVHEGEIWLDRSMVANVFGARPRAGESRQRDPEAMKIATLTEREREIIALVGEGLRNKQVADRLFISEGTVRNHLTTIFGKLEVSDRFELMIFAYRHGLAKPLL